MTNVFYRLFRVLKEKHIIFKDIVFDNNAI